MFSYLAFVYGGVTKPSDSAVKDGEDLANQCLTKLRGLDNPEQFPPQLLILLTSPAYLDQPKAAQLIAGIHQTFARQGFDKENGVPLIGSSVAAVFFERQIHEEGALLVCLASRLLKAEIAAGPNVTEDAEGAITTLLEDLHLSFAEGEDPNPFANRTLLTFFPGSAEATYPAHKIHQLIGKRVMHRIPIVGGVSSANDSERRVRAFQFAGRHVYTDAVVAARIESGVPLATSLAKGLKHTDHILRVEEVSEDGRSIKRFYEGDIAEALQDEDGLVLLGEVATESDLVVAVRLPNSDRVQVLRDINKHVALEVLHPRPKIMLEEAKQAISSSMRKIRVENPIACFSVKCASHYRWRRELRLEIETGIAKIEEMLGASPYVGGFFDGEAGTDETGRSVLGNWSVGTIVFGDEMRERTLSQMVLEPMAKYGPKLTEADSLKNAIQRSLDLVYETGFPGAMISFVLHDEEQDSIVAQGSIGPRFEKVVDMTKRPLKENDILAIVAREKRAHFVADSRSDPTCDEHAINVSGLISQYVIPLQSRDGSVIGTLQVDLGNAAYKGDLHQTEKELLDSLGTTVGAGLRQVFSLEEIRIARELDRALTAALSCETVDEGLQCYVEAAVRALRVDKGHVRLANRDRHVLVLRAGVGPYYEIARTCRNEVDFGEQSHTGQAFLEGRVTVVNDAPKNGCHTAMSKRYSRSCPDLTKVLAKVGSYANAAFKDQQGVIIGIINVVSTRPWFFNWSHERSLENLGRKVGVLVEHLKRKEGEANARSELFRASERLNFLLEVGPRLARTADFSDAPGSLARATEHFCKAAKGEIGSLYLWDDETSKFILRAQYGWASPEWVDAARYSERQGWTGSVALEDRPRYVQDLRAYRENTFHKSIGRYAVQMFGSAARDALTTEAIALPLKVGEKRLGILTLHRRLDELRPAETFATKDADDLQEAADDMVALVSALMANQDATWEQVEARKRSEVIGAVAEHVDRTVEERICEQLVRSFHAKRADLFVVTPETQSEPTWRAGFHRASCDRGLGSKPDSLVLDAARSNKVEVERWSLKDAEPTDPDVAATDGLVERACIPLLSEKRLYGIADIRWEVKRRRVSPLLTRHSSEQLQVLGYMLASAYRRHTLLAEREEARARAERSRSAVVAMGAMLFQSAHRLMNLVKNLRSMPDLIAAETTEAARNERIACLTKLIETANERIQRPMQVGKKMAEGKELAGQKPERLRNLLIQVVSESNIEEARPRIEVPDPVVSTDLMISIDPILIKEAFLNIVDNAVRAMPDGGALTIRATPDPDGLATEIVFADTGKGMTREEVDAALAGFVDRGGGAGVGLLISSMLINTQGGSLTVKSTKNSGTTVVVTLPLSPMKEI